MWVSHTPARGSGSASCLAADRSADASAGNVRGLGSVMRDGGEREAPVIRAAPVSEAAARLRDVL
ncbi:hypothetical protein GCM10010300_36380 [Streptomyces olivaceoviridis]|nr:hypothetical protein GCM10010300_36380 [Streptomyces olivaceoviridis]